jgi:hypothetical protein
MDNIMSVWCDVGMLVCLKFKLRRTVDIELRIGACESWRLWHCRDQSSMRYLFKEHENHEDCCIYGHT